MPRKRKADLPPAKFGNRILKHGHVAAGQFLANPDNWRIHPIAQQDLVTGLLEHVGFVKPVTVNLRSDPSWGESRFVETLVDGHLRVQICLSRGEDTEVPVDYVDLTPDEEAAVLASLDPSSAMATTDHEKLDVVVSRMSDPMLELTAVLRSERKAVKTVSFEATASWRVIVDCDNEGQRDALMARLAGEGYSCRVS